MVSKQSVLAINLLDARGMGRSKDRRDSDKGQIVMASSDENLLIVVQ